MRILHLLTTLDRGGAEKQVAALCRVMARRGRAECRVAYLKGDGELAPDLLAAGVPVARLGGSGRNAPATILRAARLLREVRPDLVHTHLFKADLLGIGLARRAGVPAVVSTKHNEDLYLRRAPWGALGRRAALRADRVVAVSDAVADFVRRTLDLPPAKVQVIRYGIDPAWRPAGDPAAFRASLGMAPDAPLVLAPARLARQKGLDVLLRAAALLRDRLPAARFVLAGRGEEEGALRALALSLGVGDRVRFAGFLSDPGPAFLAADAVVLPSRWEGFGLAALEAMAAGRPVVASSVGGLPEVLGETGALVPPEDPAALADALAAALAPAAVAAVRDGRAAGPLRARVEQGFSIERAADSHEALYTSLLGGGTAAAGRAERRRILLVARAGIGGAARHVRLLVSHLDPARWEVEAAVSPVEDPAFPGDLEALGARVHLLPMEREPAPLRDLRALRALRGLLREGRYDLVHAHTSKPGAFARLAAAREGVPVVYTPHGWAFAYLPGAAARALFLEVERRLSDRAAVIHCVSEAEAVRAAREGIGGGDRLRVVPNGVPPAPPADPARLSALREELRIPAGGAVALMAARLAPPKDPLAYLRASAAAGSETGATFLLAGSGPLLAECRAAAGPRARVLGERDDIADLLALTDAAVLATDYDACPYFLLEAAAAGKPLVAPPDAIPDVLRPAAAACDPSDPDALPRALRDLLAPDATPRRAAMAAAAREAWERRFTVERWVEGMEVVYGDAMRERRSGR